MDYWAAFLVGLGSAPHCVAMCGGIASALMLGSAEQRRVLDSGAPAAALSDAALFGAGKLLGYASLGLLAGLVGFAAVSAHQAMFGVLRGLSGLLMVLMGLAVGGWRGLQRIEHWAFRLWQPVLRALGRVSRSGSSGKLLTGVAWGFLPCGMVYTMLAMAVTSADAVRGSLLMMAFGLGTLPFVLAAGGLMQISTNALRGPLFRRSAAALLIGFGAFTLVMAIR